MKWLIPLLLLPLTAFGTITVTDRGTGTDTTTGTSLVITYSGTTMTAGNTGILVLAADNATGATTNLVQTTAGGFYDDSKNNRWYVRAAGFGASANVAADGYVLVSILTANLVSGDTITLTFNTTTLAKAWSWIEAAPTSGNTVMFVNSAWASSGSSSSPTITMSNFASTGDLVIGAAAKEDNAAWTADGDTSFGSWSSPLQGAVANGGTQLTSIAVGTQTKVVTDYGQQTYNPTPGATLDCRVGWVLLTETNAKARAFGQDGTSSTTSTVTFTHPLTSGSIGVLCLAADNNGTGGSATNMPSSMTDSKSNTWTLRQNGWEDNGTAGQGVEIGIYTSPIGSGGGAALVIGDTMTITYPIAVVSDCWTIWGFAPTGAGAMTYVSGALGTGQANVTTTALTTGSITNGDYVVAAWALEGNTTSNTSTGDSDTTNGSWSQQATIAVGSGLGAIRITSQWKKVTATATQSYDPTYSSGSDAIAGWISLNDSSPTGLTAAQKAAFFMLFP